MALNIHFSRCLIRCLRLNVTAGLNRYKSNIHGRIMTLEEGSLDDFTTQLIQKKVEKWSTRKTLSNKSLDITPDNAPTDNLSHLSIDKINNFFQEAIENNDNSQVLELIEQCICDTICPSVSNIIYSLNVCSQTGNINTIRSIQKLCKKLCPEILLVNSNFQHYIAEAVWVKGNTNEALNLFKEVYRENPYLRRRIRLMLKNLVVDIVTSRSEVVLLNIIKFAEDLALEYKDFFPLACIWQTCFLSDWFTDQCLALDLLNKHSELCITLINRIPYVVAVSLHNHRTEVVYRLLETLLKFELKLQYSGVLLALLDYQIHQKNIRRCVEIVQWSEQNDIELLPVHHQKYLKLLINYKDDNLVSKRRKYFKTSKTITHFKF